MAKQTEQKPEPKAWRYGTVDELLAAQCHRPGLKAFERHNDDGEVAEYWLAESVAEFLKAARPLYRKLTVRQLDKLRRERFGALYGRLESETTDES